MTELFLPYNLAVIAKNKGFDEECFAIYDAYKLLTYSTFTFVRNSHFSMPPRNYISAPLYEQIIHWFRIKHNIEVGVMRYTYSGGKYQGKKYMWFVDQFDPKYNHELEENDSHWIINERESQGYDFDDTYKAYDKALEEAFKLLP